MGAHARHGRQTARAAFLAFLLIGIAGAVGTSAAESQLDRLAIPSGKLPKGWAFVRGNYSVSEAAGDFYENYTLTYEAKTGAPLLEKRFQSFSGPGRGTVFYFLFRSADDAQRAAASARSMIWEGAEPSNAHPERILTLGAGLVIISCADRGMADQLERLIRSTPEAP